MHGFSRNTLETVLYLTLLFFLPTQFGKHFWPSFSSISGIRLDYLSPTLFLTDLLLLFLFVLSFPKIFFPFLEFCNKKKFLLLPFSLLLLLGIIFSKQPMSGLYGLLKLLEMAFFGYYTARFLGTHIPFTWAAYVFSSSLLFQSILAISQFIFRGSLGSVFYFFGERSFTMLTPGIANASIGGALVLRPYGTLPHPNVLAGFLLIGMLFLVGLWVSYKTRLQRLFVGITLVIGTGALFLSLSRTTLLLFFLMLLGVAFSMIRQKLSKRYLLFLAGFAVLAGIGLFFTPVFGRFAASSFWEESFLVRSDLAKNAIWMIWTYPLLGVGLQNFYYHLPSPATAYAYYTYIQPVHNIYLLILSQIGVLAGGIVLYFLYKTVRRVQKAPASLWQKAVFLMLFGVLVLGLVDHYFLTLQQGQLLIAFVLGLCWQFVHQKLPKKKKKK